MGRRRIHSYLVPTVEFNPVHTLEYKQNVTKEYFARHDYLSLKHNSKGLRKAIKKSSLNINSCILEGTIGYNPIHHLQKQMYLRWISIFFCRRKQICKTK